MRILLIIVILLLPINLMAQEIHGNFEIGQQASTINCYAKLNVSFDHKIWIFDNSLFGGMEVWYLYDEPYSHPFMDIYTLGYRIQYKIFYIELQHWCSHEVISDPPGIFKQRPIFNQQLSTIAIGFRW